jgi:hypothetical protein
VISDRVMSALGREEDYSVLKKRLVVVIIIFRTQVVVFSLSSLTFSSVKN